MSGTFPWFMTSFRQLSGATRRLPVLTLYTKDNCSLCDDALQALEPFQERLEKVDITRPENKKWFSKYRYDIPVFHLDGEYLMKHRTDLQLFLERLEKAEKDG